MKNLGPAYARVADDLRQAIAAGTYMPGDRLPSTAQLVETYGLSEGTIRDALGVLRSAGLIDVPGPGRPTTVRVPRPKIRREGSSRYQWEKDRVAFGGLTSDSHLAREMGQPADRTEVELIDDQVIIGDREIANALGLAPDVPVHRYTYLLGVDGVPGRIAHHYVQEELDARVRAAQPGNATDPGSVIWPGGTVYQLARQGIEAIDFVDVITARPPLPEEVEALRLPEGVSVLVLRATTGDTDGEIREVKDVIMPGDRTELVYRMRTNKWLYPPVPHDDSDVD